MPGFTLGRDPLTDQWIATSASGRFTIRGWSEQELTVARWELWRLLLADFRLALIEVYPARSLQTSRAALPYSRLRGRQGRLPVGGDGARPDRAPAVSPEPPGPRPPGVGMGS